MPWEEPHQPKYDFSEKFKDKSTRELLDMLQPAKGKLTEFFEESGRTRERPREEWSDAPAYWISEAAVIEIEQAFNDENLDRLIRAIKTESLEVPRDSDDVATTLYGEFLNLIANNGVKLPKGRTSPYGIILVVDRTDAQESLSSLQRFVATATDELLSDPHITSLILYNGEPELVRKGIDHLSRGLDIPPDYAALVLVLR
jgi:hypothetical protein